MTSRTVAARVRVEARDWQAAVRAAAQELVALGVAENAYVDACVRLVKEEGPYMVLAPGLALAHARPEQGAVKTGVSVVVLEKPVRFGHEENDPVDVVFAFCSPDSNQHVEVLSNLAGALEQGLADELRQMSNNRDARRRLAEATNDSPPL